MSADLATRSDSGQFSFALAQSRHDERPKVWPPLKITRREIEAEIERLSDLNVGQFERRAAEIVHKNASDLGIGITPGLSISVNVLLPGEAVSIDRDNANRVEFCISGEARAQHGQTIISPTKWSTWTVPSMTRRRYCNPGTEAFVWLSYSNVPILERLGVYYSDGVDAARREPSTVSDIPNVYARQSAPDFPILEDGARLRGYEFLTDIEVLENKPLIWPWQSVLPHLSRRQGDGKRTIMLLYNPATERRNGTTHSFFATITSFPAGPLRPPPPRGHKHSSYATNYHFEGAGASVVDGQHFEWEAGDLMLSAPSWSEHSHGISEHGATVLTVQDHPFQMGMESLIWQEDMSGPILTLGSEQGQTGYVGPRLSGD